MTICIKIMYIEKKMIWILYLENMILSFSRKWNVSAFNLKWKRLQTFQ